MMETWSDVAAGVYGFGLSFGNRDATGHAMGSISIWRSIDARGLRIAPESCGGNTNVLKLELTDNRVGAVSKMRRVWPENSGKGIQSILSQPRNAKAMWCSGYKPVPGRLRMGSEALYCLVVCRSLCVISSKVLCESRVLKKIAISATASKSCVTRSSGSPGPNISDNTKLDSATHFVIWFST